MTNHLCFIATFAEISFKDINGAFQESIFVYHSTYTCIDWLLLPGELVRL